MPVVDIHPTGQLDACEIRPIDEVIEQRNPRPRITIEVGDEDSIVFALQLA